MIDTLGDKMKAFERASAPEAFSRETLVYARVDGRGFSRFTQGMKKPFDIAMTDAMQLTAELMMKETGAKAAYVQSDEISLIWEPTPEVGEHYFGGKPFKMVSSLSAEATSLFVEVIREQHPDLVPFLKRRPRFDARVVGLPDRETATEAFAWRGQDARRNAVTMIAQANYSHKSLQGVSSQGMRERLAADGIFPEDFHQPSLNGTLIHSIQVQMPLEDEIRMNIPEHKRPAPDHLFDRRINVVYCKAHPGAITNLQDVIFEGAKPQTAETRKLETA